MAEIAVTGTLALAQLVISFIQCRRIREVGLKDKIIIMKDSLAFALAFIQRNDGYESNGSGTLDVHLKNIRDIVYEIEDVLDLCILYSPPYLFHDHHTSRSVHTLCHNIWYRFPLKRISDRIFAIETRMNNLKPQLGEFPSASYTRPTTSVSRISPLLRDHEMLGYEIHRRKLITSLLEDGNGFLSLAIVGASGSGKTALVRNVFSRAEIQKQFNFRAWVHVGRNSDTRTLIVNLLKQLKIIDDAMDDDNKLHNCLARNRYMIVLDDVRENIDLNIIKNVFRGGSLGSRLIVTTTVSNLASSIGSTTDHVFKLEGLDWPDAWNLFCRIAFERTNGKCPAELENSANEIITICERLPRNLVVMGDALARKDLPSDWVRFRDNLASNKNWKDSELKAIYNGLQPEYMSLSSNCKSCFLYFSMFPEGYSVQRGRLIRLWVAEGFAVKSTTQTPEEVGEGYLEELINKNLVDVSKRDIDGRPTSCRVQNLVLKFIVQKCEHENFASVFNREHTSCSQKIRRLSVHPDCCNLPPRNNDFSGVRSMFLLRLLGLSPSDFNGHLKETGLLKVLDFQNESITQFPKAITDLTLMKYLSFRGTKIRAVPSSIEKLSYLETLDLKQTDVTELPKEISHLHNLCHLFVYKYYVQNYVLFNSVQAVEIPCSIGKMTNLQDLTVVKVGKDGTILKDLNKLKGLRKLGLVGIKDEHGSDLCAVINGNPGLRTLDLHTNTQQDYLQLGMVNERGPQLLRRLYLKGLMRELPAWISSLDNVIKVALKWSQLKCSPLKALECLPNLLELQLIGCYTGQELMFQSSGFQKLKVLLIEDLQQLNTVQIQHGAMPDLEQLSLHLCPWLEMFPQGMENLKQLKEVTLRDMPEKLAARISKNMKKTKHKPTIECFRLNKQSGLFERIKYF